ncbi:uncharacterized protein MONOS_7683 [Monocercomonoides exilis]|uniref:uncharacterized protein n=1 Tax=Monocercomonoides exilis TaxID=2049356 RepID=UPI00355A8A9E|nr:hypothetical protein MONOS_7683 [Monocercomonoides exilis]|eukprot:MONOS_7683.1-p1 / transcript=MONOS_7683.1 / gene=MONOS_7683 / organism=Monocercomonoides_exilis_PA203 / gene_product=unspecified product / transcript_product=unspecified product / location=Mono_scaffold00269:5179-7886(-) / protein_length=502 / sequence_SO=supercontig / SO=protein_coding / is_pseudo=false
MSLPPPPNALATWWQGTDLEMSHFGSDNLSRIATLAENPQAFCQRFVITKNVAELERNAKELLNTTEEYAHDFAMKTIEYFEQIWLPKHPIQIGQVRDYPLQPSLPSAIPSSSVVTTVSKQPVQFTTEQHNESSMTRFEIIQSIERMKKECMDSSSSKIDELRDYAVKEITAMREGLKANSDMQQRLADSFNQLRQFIEEFVKTHQQQPQPQPQPQLQPQMGVTSSFYPPSAPISVSMMPGSSISSASPSSSTIPSTAYPSYPSYPATTQQPYTSSPPPSGSSAYGSSAWDYGINDLNEYGVSRAGGAGAFDLNEPADLTAAGQLVARDPNAVKITGKNVTWVKKTETTVFVDYVVLENVVSVEWKPYLQQGTIFKDTSTKFGFIMDVMGNNSSHEEADKIFVEYKCSGKMHIRTHTEHLEPFTTGDLIRIELNMSKRTAMFFKNDAPLPIVITNIPKVNKFYVTAKDLNTRIEFVSMKMMSKPTHPTKLPGWKEIAMDKV